MNQRVPVVLLVRADKQRVPHRVAQAGLPGQCTLMGMAADGYVERPAARILAAIHGVRWVVDAASTPFMPGHDAALERANLQRKGEFVLVIQYAFVKFPMPLPQIVDARNGRGPGVVIS